MQVVFEMLTTSKAQALLISVLACPLSPVPHQHVTLLIGHREHGTMRVAEPGASKELAGAGGVQKANFIFCLSIWVHNSNDNYPFPLDFIISGFFIFKTAEDCSERKGWLKNSSLTKLINMSSDTQHI